MARTRSISDHRKFLAPFSIHFSAKQLVSMANFRHLLESFLLSLSVSLLPSTEDKVLPSFRLSPPPENLEIWRRHCIVSGTWTWITLALRYSLLVFSFCFFLLLFNGTFSVHFLYNFCTFSLDLADITHHRCLSGITNVPGFNQEKWFSATLFLWRTTIELSGFFQLRKSNNYSLLKSTKRKIVLFSSLFKMK